MDTPLAVVGVVMALQGAGFGMASSPALVAGLSDLPPALVAQGTAIRSLTREVSGSVSVAVLGAVVALRMGQRPVGGAVPGGLQRRVRPWPPSGWRSRSAWRCSCRRASGGPAVKVDATTVALAAE